MELLDTALRQDKLLLLLSLLLLFVGLSSGGASKVLYTVLPSIVKLDTDGTLQAGNF